MNCTEPVRVSLRTWTYVGKTDSVSFFLSPQLRFFQKQLFDYLPFIFRLFELSQRGPHLKGVCVELMSLPLWKSQVESEVNEVMNHALIDGLPEAKGPTADRYGYVRNVHAIMDVCIQDCPTSGNNKKSD